MAEDQELRARSGRGRVPDSADVVTSASLFDQLYVSPAKGPFVGEETSAAVGVIFLKAGRLDQCELTQSVHHLREPFAKVSKESLGKRYLGHDREMVTTAVPAGNGE
jgi:hypothetical protein